MLGDFDTLALVSDAQTQKLRRMLSLFSISWEN